MDQFIYQGVIYLSFPLRALKKILPHYPLLLSEIVGYLNGYMIWYIRWVVLESSPISR